LRGWGRQNCKGGAQKCVSEESCCITMKLQLTAVVHGGSLVHETQSQQLLDGEEKVKEEDERIPCLCQCPVTVYVCARVCACATLCLNQVRVLCWERLGRTKNINMIKDTGQGK